MFPDSVLRVRVDTVHAHARKAQCVRVQEVQQRGAAGARRRYWWLKTVVLA